MPTSEFGYADHASRSEATRAEFLAPYRRSLLSLSLLL
jgi:hypothetical protein